MKKVYIMRGPSGCGKSTAAQKLCDEDSYICSADTFFMVDGNYKFDPKRLHQAHETCKSDFTHLLKRGVKTVIVDNTNTQFWEAQFYIFTALAYDYEVEIVEPTTEWAFNVEELVKRNVHGVPKESIEKMVKRYENHSEFIGKIAEITLFKIKRDE